MALTFQSPSAIDTSETWLAVRSRNTGSGIPGSYTTYLAGEINKGLKDRTGNPYGAYKPPKIIDPGRPTSFVSDPISGQMASNSHSLLVADADHFWRGIRDAHGGNLVDAEFWYYQTSRAWRLAGGDPRLLTYGYVSSNQLAAALVAGITARDVFGHTKRMYTKPPMLPQRVIRGSNYMGTVAFPNFVDPDLYHPRAVPFSMGPCIAKDSTIYGAVPAICLNEFTMADATTWILGLLVGNDAKNGIASLFQPVDKNDIGLILDADPDVKWPGQTTPGWSTINPSGAVLYTDISGERFLLFAVKADSVRGKAFKDGSRPIYANFGGPTSTADGTGTELVDAHQIAYWALNNFIIRTPGYLTGSYYSAPPDFDFFPGGSNAVPMADLSSFARSATIATAMGGIKWGGLVGWNGDQSQADSVLADMNRSKLSMMAWCGDKHQLTDVMLDRTRSTFLRTTKVLEAFTKLGTQLGDPFTEEQRYEWFMNNLNLKFAFEGRNSRYVGNVQLPGDDEQFLSHPPGVYKEINAPFIIDDASATVVCQAMLDMYSTMVPSLSKWSRALVGFEDNIGDGRLVTHFNGNGSSGYNNAAHWILGRDVDIKTGRIIHTGMYVDSIVT